MKKHIFIYVVLGTYIYVFGLFFVFFWVGVVFIMQEICFVVAF